ncbi:CarD family transcriptional regulator [Sinanaerobacter chloroacetimidivorans]|jgi:CarD family transcriptional regulator|uniref:CarD family transcriptional regulator n=1 Tax=Sinanaerobacter chloroacetimidivorans TaxID=2818044 RepID=A0A8J8B3M6_9FIRM|nr:CarD family transcriptional regulator [Sinanaerobacter chloroacetimidivorans]MBR0600474.1 CarD family transcriptional regulator [Sinanaerobacter chloroacetimidivorans]
MFAIGDKIVYPMHGAGIIEEIEEKKILGESRKYYILRVPCGDMKIMIPIESSEEIGVRGIISMEEINAVIAFLGRETSEMSNNWNRRYRENMEKLKSGDIYNVAEVVRNLMRTDKEKKLSTGEKKMLSNAKQILVSEIILVKGIDQDAAIKLIHSAI